jgi:hypothetical protein
LRSAIRYTLNSQGLTVYLSEASDFDVSGERTAIEECFNNIRACDYFVLIIGNKRGQPFDDQTSITRQEYRVARDQFLISQRPRLLFYLSRETEAALQSGEPGTRKAGIDHPDHLRSFIDEVEHPPIHETPNYLTRFHDFEDLIQSLAGRLNIGRNLSETLTRHSLVYELASNLRCMVYRNGSSVFPRHLSMSKIREEIPIKPQDIGGETILPPVHVSSLAMALLGRIQARQLHTRIMEDAVAHGVFLTFNPSSSALEESAIQKSIRQILDDVAALNRLDTPPNQNWDSNLLKCIERRLPGTERPLKVANVDLIAALAHYDRAANLFDGQLALCKVLLGVSERLEPHERHPVTPLGEEMNQKMRAELVSEEEILHLVEHQVCPFGPKIPPEMLDALLDEQSIRGQTETLRKTMTEFGIEDMSQERLENIVRETLQKFTAEPDECIDDLRDQTEPP